MTHQNLNAIGWKPFFEQQVSPDHADVTIARVSAHHGGEILLLGVEGELRVPVQLVESVGDIAVGDWLVLDAKDHRAIKRLGRQTFLCRKAAGEKVQQQVIAANIDTIFIVSSCNREFNLSRLERYLALALQSGATPVVVLTKADLCDSAAQLRRQVEKLLVGLVVESLDAREPEQAKTLQAWCGPGQSIALLGSSGVGKSTLAIALGVVGLATGEIREGDDKGHHTTTARSLHRLPSGGILVDNPGMRELQLPACPDGVTDLFDDVLRLAAGCRFSDCSHQGDAGCAVTAALESGELDQRRFHSYQKLQAEQAHHARTLAERRERNRKTGRYYKSVLASKRRQRGES